MKMINPTTPNRLINEKSPYLLQHAYNPVNWYAWSDEAFERAKAEHKPIFLSIGYSTCHWCHVMAHETFESEDAGEILNKYFISIKVDREERPDIDGIYMTACQAFMNSGGWPLSAFLDHEKNPFLVGTYYPKNIFKNLLLQIAEIWSDERDKLLQQAKQVTAVLSKQRKISGYTSVEKADKKATDYLTSHFDKKYGGFSSAPKFPSPHNLLFLTEYYSFYGDKNSLNMCETTLRAMRSGGIYDHIGGGFSRYSTDSKWIVPHFEKMLYDNALLITAYSKIYNTTHDIYYANVVSETASYLMRDMCHPEGVFYTAEDADSEGHEGLFYTFSLKEIEDILDDDAGEFCAYYNITAKGSFEGKNVLNTVGMPVPHNRQDFADNCLKKLYDYRAKRIRPHRDEKILTSLNGLAIAAFSIAGMLLQRPEYIETAKRAAEFIEKNLEDDDGGLLSSYFDAPGKIPAFAEDYAFYIWGLLELHKATDNAKHLAHAIKLQDRYTYDFFDFENGGFYLSGKTAEKLIIRTKEIYDGAAPSSNSVSIHNLFAIYSFTKDIKYMEQLIKTIKCFSDDIAAFPHGHIHSVSALLLLKKALPEIRICRNTVCRPAAKTIDELISYFEN